MLEIRSLKSDPCCMGIAVEASYKADGADSTGFVVGVSNIYFMKLIQQPQQKSIKQCRSPL